MMRRRTHKLWAFIDVHIKGGALMQAAASQKRDKNNSRIGIGVGYEKRRVADKTEARINPIGAL